MSMNEGVALLRRLSEELASLSGGTAERLASLASAIENPDVVTGWAGIDPFRAIDVQAVGDLVLTSPDRDPVLARFEQIRNVLTLLPILLTWLALFFAGGAYRDAVQADPALTQEPFLLLWEQGFNGYAQGGLGLLSMLTLSNVAITDVAVIAVVVLVTGYIHRETNIKQTHRARRAVELQEQLSQALWLAAMQLAQRVSVRVQQDQLRVVTEQLLDELRAERERIRELAETRAQEIQGLSSFVKQFRSGVRDLAHAADVLRADQLALVELGGAVYDQLAMVSGRTAEASHAIDGIEQQLSRSSQTAITKLDTILVAIDGLRDSSRQSIESALKGIEASVGMIEGRYPQIESALRELDVQVIRTSSLVMQALSDDRVTSAVAGIKAAVDELGTVGRDQSEELRGLKGDWHAQIGLVASAEQSLRQASASVGGLVDRLENDGVAASSEALLNAMRSTNDQLARTANSLNDLQKVIAELQDRSLAAPTIELEPVYRWRLFGPAGLRRKQRGK
jgi:coenzyme F420-reducing hydrogenase delta subunit